MKKRKVLIVITTGLYQYGGLSTVALNYLKAIDRKQLQIDFCSFSNPGDDVMATLLKCNSEYFKLADRKKNTLHYILGLRKICAENKYDVIHIHGNSSTMIIELIAACLGGVGKRIAHVHTTKSNHPLANKILHPLFKLLYTDAIAVSKQAGEWLFGDSFTILNNAIDIKKYEFSACSRKKVREELGLTNQYVIGTVGKLNLGKNHKFMLEVFSNYHYTHNNSVLMIIGGGDEEQNLRNKALELGVKNSVLFLGMKDHVEEYYSAMDFFLFTSLFEGLGMVLIEAQIAGLKCLSSDCVPIETRISDRISYLSLDDSISDWAEEIGKSNDINERMLSADNLKDIVLAGYDISREEAKLRHIYLN